MDHPLQGVMFVLLTIICVVGVVTGPRFFVDENFEFYRSGKEKGMFFDCPFKLWIEPLPIYFVTIVVSATLPLQLELLYIFK